MDNYTIYHLHTTESNPSSGTGADSVTRYDQYLDRAKEVGMKNFCFSEHGTISNWMKKKDEVELRGMKYIHANEIYLTEHKDKERGLIRDNYHYMMIAKNLDGVKELNKLTSKSFNRQDGGFYYNPRVSFDELKNTSDNILMTSACLASPLWRMSNNDKTDQLNDMLDFMYENRHRMFFEVQYHDHPEQVEFNKWLLDLSKDMDIPLIAGTDTHALNKDHLEARKVLMRAKGASYGDEDVFDLTFKTYEELVNMFKKQNALPESSYLEAIENTNIMADMVDEFTVDDSPKYPKLYNDSIEVFNKHINKGLEKRGVNDFDEDKRNVYLKRVEEELDTYKKLGAVDYMLLQKNIIDWGRERGIDPGYGRGSVSGSLIAYLLGITEMDSIKHGLSFTRFLNPARVTMADIDVDLPPSRRKEVIDYVASLEGVYFSEIITFNTVAMKGAIREVGRALDIPLSEIDNISKNIEDQEGKFREEYPELFKYVDIINGTIVSVGSHPSGFLVSPVPLDENIGLTYTKESKYPVSLVNMKDLDNKKYVKLDMLGLDNIEIINEACKMAGIERLTPDNVDMTDRDVWESMKDSTLGVFQWESEMAFSYIKRLFDKKTLGRIEEKKGGIDFLNILSAGNGAIRPAGASYRDDFADGNFHDNGNKDLNNMLESTNGFLIYQEQINRFLVEFCGFTDSEADIVRRGIAKKGGTEESLPKIKSGFINTMTNKYNLNKSRAEEIIEYFLEIIENASQYGFSINHSAAYSCIGYVGAYLRYHYPLEFFTAILNINDDDIEKTSKIIDLAKKKGINIKPIEYGKSSADYNLNRDENAIYKGIGSIKHLNARIADELLSLSKNTYESFVEMLIDIVCSSTVNSTQLEILIRLDYFKEFGDKYLLLVIVNEFKNGKHRFNKNHKQPTKDKRIPILIDFEKKRLNDGDKESRDISEQVLFERDILGYGQTTFEKVGNKYFMVLDVNTKYTPRLTLYRMCDGTETQAKINKKIYFEDGNPLLEPGDIFKVVKGEKKNKKRKIDGKWQSIDEKENWLVGWELSKKYRK